MKLAPHEHAQTGPDGLADAGVIPLASIRQAMEINVTRSCKSEGDQQDEKRDRQTCEVR